jgi:DNA-binding beta-propeller fold protein YncE
MRWGGFLVAVLIGLPAAAPAQPADPLTLETRIPLGDIAGRIDHMAIDLKRRRLFVAELGNNTLGIVDLAAGKVTQTLAGFSEPQGVGYEPTTDTVYVTNAGDGSVRVLRGNTLAPLPGIDLADDADNVRLDARRRRVLVGYGDGGIAAIDPTTRAKVAEFPLNGHPESFQIDETGDRIFVNVPRRGEIVTIDLASGAMGSISTGGMRSNFPMALDPDAHRVLTVFRNPPLLIALATADGKAVSQMETCGDADDVFVDRKRHRIYITCGAGAIDVIEPQGDGYRRVGQLPTAPSARTALFVPELDRLYVAVANTGSSPASVWVFRPTP